MAAPKRPVNTEACVGGLQGKATNQKGKTGKPAHHKTADVNSTSAKTLPAHSSSSRKMHPQVSSTGTGNEKTRGSGT